MKIGDIVTVAARPTPSPCSGKCDWTRGKPPTCGRVRYISPNRWAALTMLNESGKALYTECFFLWELGGVVNA